MGVLRLYPLGRVRQYWDELSLPLERQMEALAALRPPAGVELMQSWHPQDPNCCWQMAAVDAYGYSIGCPYLRDFANYGNVRDGSLMETWNHPQYQAVRSVNLASACPECGGRDGNSWGGCRSSAFAFTGRWDGQDPFCIKMNQGIDLTQLPEWLRKAPAGRISLPVLEKTRL